MGEAKRRRLKAAEDAQLPTERLLLRGAAKHLHDRFVAPNQLPGACHYTAFGLHHYLATQHGVVVPVQVGFVRSDDVAWATHSWLEQDGRKTDIAIHYPNPPVRPGPLLIDGELIARGHTACFYTLVPDDDVPTAIELSVGTAAGQRRAREHRYFVDLAAAGDLPAIERYLSEAPHGLYDSLLAVWAQFNS